MKFWTEILAFARSAVLRAVSHTILGSRRDRGSVIWTGIIRIAAGLLALLAFASAQALEHA